MFKMILRGEINMVRLKDIASISTGMTFGSKPEPLIGSHVRLMQLGNLDVSGEILFENMIGVAQDDSYEEYFAEEGDLVFRGRGAGIAVAVMPPHQGNVAIVAPLILIRPNRTLIEPGYLAWVLEAPKAQRHYARYAQGTVLMGIGKKDLETVGIDMPSMETQKKLSALVALQKKEEKLLNQYRTVRKQLVSALLCEIIVKSRKG
jgi:type I restriction enzyme M protein